ncbi:zinc ribbon-containing protein [Endozoicomonas sp. G2_1]|uniref:zinc ribbon-containing protein n=1 Tax=Endozoicomonas sp. G2_1 TaxID=2821091 RepID=UPI001ADD3379|nr:zinc ribbon-containing protein [Endozoicomonas sp. G2_1]MBO9491609.1 zinc ribbon-containing protein [Endozoicomonas sp. G2_1]
MSEREQGLFDRVYRQLSVWLEDVNQHELVSLIELVEKTKQYLHAAEQIPEQQLQQFTDNLQHDLVDFYHQYQDQSRGSTYLGLLTENWWAQLALMTDKTQVEWAELLEDFEHRGEYREGDYIGFGELVCDSCHHSTHVYHYSQVIACPHCGGKHFIRKALKP